MGKDIPMGNDPLMGGETDGVGSTDNGGVWLGTEIEVNDETIEEIGSKMPFPVDELLASDVVAADEEAGLDVRDGFKIGGTKSVRLGPSSELVCEGEEVAPAEGLEVRDGLRIGGRRSVTCNPSSGVDEVADAGADVGDDLSPPNTPDTTPGSNPPSDDDEDAGDEGAVVGDDFLSPPNTPETTPGNKPASDVDEALAVDDGF